MPFVELQKRFTMCSKCSPSPCRGSPQCRTAAQRSAACETDEPGAVGWSSHAGHWTWGCSVCEELFEPAEKVKELLKRELWCSLFVLEFILLCQKRKVRFDLPAAAGCLHGAWWGCVYTPQHWRWFQWGHGPLSWHSETYWTALERTQTTVASDVPRQSRSTSDA